MKCPVCGASMVSMVCSCGYDESHNCEKYPVLGRLPGVVVSVAGLRDRRKNLIRCGGCGNYGFSLNVQEKMLCCLRCGRALTETELKPLTDALGMKKAEPKLEPKPKEPAAQPPEKTNTARLAEFGDLLNVLKKQASSQDDSRRIISIAAGWSHTVALYADGTAAAIGDNGEGECEVSSWRDIIAVSAGNKRTTGLKKDGSVVTTNVRLNAQICQWRDVVAIADGLSHIVGLKRDGTVVMAGSSGGKKSDVSLWRNIQAIAAGGTFTLGLEKSGKVVVSGNGSGAKLPSGGWRNVKAIAAGYEHSAALDNDGRVLIAGNGGRISELGTSNAGLGAGCRYTAVWKHNGTASITGLSRDGRSDVKQWTDLEMIAAGYYHTVGLKKDGTLVATGDNSAGQCDVHKLVRK